MGAKLIDGKKFSLERLEILKKQVDSLKRKHNATPTEKSYLSPRFAIILVGDNPSSVVYVRNKIKAAKVVGIYAESIKFDDNVSEKELLQKIEIMNQIPAIHGIIVQMPLPDHISKSKVINAITPEKDIDGFHPYNLGLLYSPFESNLVPGTALGCVELLKSILPNLTGKRIAILGRSNIVGRPLAALLLGEDATVTICHSKTIDMKKITQESEIVISSLGKPRMLGVDYFNKDAIVIDVGITRIIENGVARLVGDVDFDKVKEHVAYITPVPGGVGPMTVTCLLENCFKACRKKYEKK